MSSLVNCQEIDSMHPVINVADLNRISNLYFQGQPQGPAILIDVPVSAIYNIPGHSAYPWTLKMDD